MLKKYEYISSAAGMENISVSYTAVKDGIVNYVRADSCGLNCASWSPSGYGMFVLVASNGSTNR